MDSIKDENEDDGQGDICGTWTSLAQCRQSGHVIRYHGTSLVSSLTNEHNASMYFHEARSGMQRP